MNNSVEKNESREQKFNTLKGLSLTKTEVTSLYQACRSARILVIGSLNIDLILEINGCPEDDSTLTIRSESTLPGGHAGNCAAALAKLGVSVAILGAIGTDSNGDILINDLSQRGIDVSYVQRVSEAPTGRVIIPLFSNQHFMLMSRGANEYLTANDIEEAISNADAIITFDPTPIALHALMKVMISNPKKPPLFWNPGGIYAGDKLVDMIIPACHTLIVNRHEYSLITCDSSRLSIHEDIPEIITTLGFEGSQLQANNMLTKVPSPSINAVDPTGAGDTFTAAYVVSFIAGLEATQRLRFANIAGAIATMAKGARGNLPTLAQLVTTNITIPTH
ncbi:carbohydrate kinase family protein [Sodalis sp. C49]|uniref:carbohydrate kinase family protein n=1 Tax=Sodalis sp. C49 TaxID=3228929 RepID=UPI003965B12A